MTTSLLFYDETFKDLELIIKDRNDKTIVMNVHKSVLNCMSIYFRAVFSKNNNITSYTMFDAYDADIYCSIIKQFYQIYDIENPNLYQKCASLICNDYLNIPINITKLYDIEISEEDFNIYLETVNILNLWNNNIIVSTIRYNVPPNYESTKQYFDTKILFRKPRYVAINQDERITIYDIDTKKITKTDDLEKYHDYCTFNRFSKDGKYLMMRLKTNYFGYGDLIIQYNLITCTHVRLANVWSPNDIKFYYTNNGKNIVFIGGSIDKIQDVGIDFERKVLSLGCNVNVTITHDEKYVIESDQKHILIHNVGNFGQTEIKLIESEQAITSYAFHSKFINIYKHAGFVRTISYTSNEKINKVLEKLKTPLVVVANDDSFIICCNYNDPHCNTLTLYNGDDFTNITQFIVSEYIIDLSLSNDNSVFITQSMLDIIGIYDVKTGKLIHEIKKSDHTGKKIFSISCSF
jgi:WD40 repeat protein